MIIEYEVKNVYGVLKAYPVNTAAKIFAEIAGTKTLCVTVLQRAQELGHEIKQVHKEFAI